MKNAAKKPSSALSSFLAKNALLSGVAGLTTAAGELFGGEGSGNNSGGGGGDGGSGGDGLFFEPLFTVGDVFSDDDEEASGDEEEPEVVPSAAQEGEEDYVDPSAPFFCEEIVSEGLMEGSSVPKEVRKQAAGDPLK